MITKNDYDYDYSQRKLITIMIIKPWLWLWWWVVVDMNKHVLLNVKWRPGSRVYCLNVATQI